MYTDIPLLHIHLYIPYLFIPIYRQHAKGKAKQSKSRNYTKRITKYGKVDHNDRTTLSGGGGW